jgi:hypothetical protein
VVRLIIPGAFTLQYSIDKYSAASQNAQPAIGVVPSHFTMGFIGASVVSWMLYHELCQAFWLSLHG